MAPSEAALQVMFVVFQLRKLVHGYCRAVDRGDMAQLRGMYHDDAKDDHGTFASGTVDDFLGELAATVRTSGRRNTTSPR
jgi:hypothetical protein